MDPTEYRAWWEGSTSVPYGFCWCGCGGRTNPARQNHTKAGTVRGEPVRFAAGHAARAGLCATERKLSGGQKDAIIRRYRDGDSAALLAAEYGVGKSTILGHLKRAGVARRSGRPDTLLTDEQLGKAARRVLAGETCASVARGLGVAEWCVREPLARRGIRSEGRPRGYTRPDMWTIPIDEHAGIVARYLSGESCKELAALRGVSAGTIKLILKRGGVRMRRSRKPLSPEQDSEVCARYLAGETPKTISDATGIASSTVWFVLNRNGIKERQVVKISASQKAEACRLYEAGESIDAIDEKTGVSGASVYLALRQQGLGPQRKSRVLEWEETRAAYAIRRLPIYRKWRESVLDRDGYKCRRCGSETSLHVHHLLPFVELLAEHRPLNVLEAERYAPLWDLDNGLTLCRTCHRAEHGDAC